MIFTPLVNQRAMEVCSLAEIMDGVKGASAHKINKVLGRRGRLWQPESFDHVLRSSESLDAKIVYLLENLFGGLVREWMDYPWFVEEAVCESLCSSFAVRASEKSWAAPCDSRGRLSPHKQFCYSRPRVCGRLPSSAGMFSEVPPAVPD